MAKLIRKPAQVDQDPGSLASKAIDHVVMSIGNGPSVAELATLNSGQRALYAIYWFQYETRNGGMSQFFRNHSGDAAPEAVEGLRLIGADDYADILAKAMSIFGSAYPRDADRRWTILKPHIVNDEVGIPLLESLENRYYALLKGARNLDRMTDDYVSKHEDQFFTA